MTDDERREAKEKWQLSGGESGTRLQNLLVEYEAANKSWRVAYDSLIRENHWAKDQFRYEVKQERARSAKLIKRLQLIRTMDSPSDVWARITSAIAEYEAGG